MENNTSPLRETISGFTTPAMMLPRPPSEFLEGSRGSEIASATQDDLLQAAIREISLSNLARTERVHHDYDEAARTVSAAQSQLDLAPDLPMEPAMKRASGVRFQTPSLSFEPPLRKNDKKAVSSAKRIVKACDKLHEHREDLRGKRTDLAYFQSSLADKQSFLVSSIELLIGFLVNVSTRSNLTQTGPDEYAQLYKQYQDDLEAFQEQTKKTVALEEDISVREAGMLDVATKLHQYSHRFIEHAGNLDDAASITGSDTSEHTTSQTPGQRKLREEVESYLDKVGDQRILRERYAELHHEFSEERARQELLLDQERPVSPGYARRTDAFFVRELEEVEEALRQADAEVERALARCEANGIRNPERYIDESLDGSFDDDHDESDSSDRGVQVVQTDIMLQHPRDRLKGIKTDPFSSIVEWQPKVSNNIDLGRLDRWLSALPQDIELAASESQNYSGIAMPNDDMARDADVGMFTSSAMQHENASNTPQSAADDVISSKSKSSHTPPAGLAITDKEHKIAEAAQSALNDILALHQQQKKDDGRGGIT